MRRLRPPWWFCCGWWSPWCVLDTAAHVLHIKWQRVCDAHDRAIMGDDDWNEAEFDAAFEKGESVELDGKPTIIVSDSLKPTSQTWGSSSGYNFTFEWPPK